MQTIELNFYQRIMLWNMLGAKDVPNLKEASVYLPVMAKIRLTDQEATEAQFLSEGPQVSWRLPSPTYGTKEIELEEAEAKALATVVETPPQGLKLLDAEWLKRLAGELTNNNNVPETVK